MTGVQTCALPIYLCARAATTGVIRDRDVSAAFGDVFRGAADYAESRLRKAYDQKADPWYRLAAAYRLGLPLVDPLAAPEAPAIAPPHIDSPESTSPSSPSSTAPAGSATEATSASTVPGYPGSSAGASGGGKKAEPAPVSPDEYALSLAKFGLGKKLRSELGTEFSSLARDTVRSVAETLSAADRHDQAYRLIATLFWKADFTPTRRDAELYWPRPYRDQFAAAVQATGLDEFLLYGLARSESAFDPKAVSKSGAVGLTQLMPATAAETAKRLRMEEFDLNDPADNLAIGSAYFARVMGNLDGRVLPAVFSYNGGPTRFRRWEAEYGALPLDLLLEALSYSETRQYGRNVATAALSYAALYGEGDLRTYFAWLIGEGPRP